MHLDTFRVQNRLGGGLLSNFVVLYIDVLVD